ncbi:unnamed protein product, partial [marine sediment metagenome]
YADSVVLCPDSGCSMANEIATASDLTMRRFMIFAANGRDFLSGNNAQDWADIDIDGFIYADTTVGADEMTSKTGTIVSAENICIMSSTDDEAAVFPDVTDYSTLMAKLSITPTVDDDGLRLRSFMARSDINTPCERARPRKLGLSEFGVVHALLGDFAVEQYYNLSGKDIINPGGGDGRGSGHSEGAY